MKQTAREVTLVVPYIPPQEAFPRNFEGRHWSARSGVKVESLAWHLESEIYD